VTNSRVKIVEKIFNANDRIAEENQEKLAIAGIFSINIMASPGSGKTSLILQTIRRLPTKWKIGVIEGDTAPVTIDAEKIIKAGMPAVQINTGGACHLDAAMISEGINGLPINEIQLLIVENVGNLICPADFKLGTHKNIVIASIPEGDDKPYKYPNIYRGIDALILNKIDLIPYVDFNIEYFQQGIQMLNPEVNIFPLSCKTGEGLNLWIDWVLQNLSSGTFVR
jgi:hydrogenase nickel incorporation protein HypB